MHGSVSSVMEVTSAPEFDSGLRTGSTIQTQRRVFAVIVLYKIAAAHSASFNSLLRSAAQATAGELSLEILLYDNSPEATSPVPLPEGVTYRHDPGNSGLAKAYNSALAMAEERKCEWFLTLDQDTELPADYFQQILPILSELEERLDVASVVPAIQAGNRALSPNTFVAGAWPRWFPQGYRGVPTERVYAFNSGSLLRVAALRQIGGYSPWFWLDNSDAFLYRQLAKFGKRVYVAGHIRVEHDFSMLHMSQRVSPERYRTILLAESAFWDMEMNGLAGLERTARLAARLWKHWRRRDPPELRRLTVAALKDRLLHTRAYRLLRWHEATLAKIGPQVSSPSQRPRVSVCMAAYNGERYIDAQLRTIAQQLGPEDEIVIVDDCSRDATPDRIRSFAAALPPGIAPAIRLTVHRKNCGVVPTFEEAVRGATGDILFLADNDDLWVAEKVRRTLEAFTSDPQVMVVATGVSLIDEQDRPLDPSVYLGTWQFTNSLPTNILVHNSYQGSTMAFRSVLLQHVLPFPAGRLFLHDAWIGTRNTLTGGKTAYLPEPLLLYRRHTGNFSQKMSHPRKVLARLQLIAAHLGRAWAGMGGRPVQKL